MDAVRAHGFEENTLVFVTSDNGAPTGENNEDAGSNYPLRGISGTALVLCSAEPIDEFFFHGGDEACADDAIM